MKQVDDFEVFRVRDFRLESGMTLGSADLAYSTEGDIQHGSPLLTCTAFSQTPADLAYLAEAGGPLEPGRRLIIRTELLGNGRSASPSNAPAPQSGADFPVFTIGDNVRLQRLLLDHLGVDKVGCVIGASMGGQQAIEWVCQAPTRVGSAIVIAANAYTTVYGRLFLNAVRGALTSDPAFAEGRYKAPPRLGLARLSEVWAPFALSPRFFSTGLWRQQPDMAADDVEGFLAKWRTRYFAKDANDLLTHLDAWAAHDVARGSDLAAIASMIRRPILFAPISTDVYFNADDVADQARAFPNATVRVVESLSGHAAAFGRQTGDRAVLGALVESWLESEGL